MGQSEVTPAAMVLCSTGGIGFAVAETLNRRGAAVGICGRDQGRVDAAVAQLRRSGGTAEGWVTDITDPVELDDLFDGFLAHFGRLDVLVNNTPPSTGHGPFVDIDLATWDTDYGRLLRPIIQACLRAAPAMASIGGGSIVNITSGSVVQPIVDHTISTALRSAVHGLSAVLTGQLGPDGIRVNCVAPYGVVTPTLRERLGEDRLAEREGQIAVRHLGKPEDVAETVAFLALGPGYVSGVTIPVDGGYVRML